jgi:hypothetical protein
MDIIPIQSLPALSAAAPAAIRADFATTRAIEFHPQGQDATYTPSGSEDGDGNQQPSREALEASSEAGPEAGTEFEQDSPSDDFPLESTISLFA